jgi:hypothetical protein
MVSPLRRGSMWGSMCSMSGCMIHVGFYVGLYVWFCVLCRVLRVLFRVLCQIKYNCICHMLRKQV